MSPIMFPQIRSNWKLWRKPLIELKLKFDIWWILKIKAQFKHRVGPLVVFDCNLLIKFFLGFLHNILYWLLFKVAYVLLKDPFSKGYLVNLSYSMRFKRKTETRTLGKSFRIISVFPDRLITTPCYLWYCHVRPEVIVLSWGWRSRRIRQSVFVLPGHPWCSDSGLVVKDWRSHLRPAWKSTVYIFTWSELG